VTVFRSILPVFAASLALAGATVLSAQTVTISSFPAGEWVVQASDGNYWTTAGQTVQSVTPDGTVTTVANFSSVSSYDITGLLEGQDGYFYGLLVENSQECPNTLFRLSATGTVTTFYLTEICNITGFFQGVNGNLYVSYDSGLFKFSTNGTFIAGATLPAPSDGGTVSTTASPLLASDGNIYVPATSEDFDSGFSNSILFQLPQSLDNVVSYITLEGGSNEAYPSSGSTEGANGNLYLTSLGYYELDSVSIGSNPTDSVIDLKSDAASQLFAASDGQLYGSTSIDEGTFSIYTLNTATSAVTAFYTGSGGGLPITIQGSDGAFYGGGSRTALSPALLPPVQLTPSATTVTLGSPFTLNWEVLNATSLQAQLCYAFLANFTTVPGWSGLQTGTVTNGVMSGSATITLTTPGTYSFALTCGGIESGNATVTISGTSATTTDLQTSTPTVVAPGQASLTATVATAGGSPVSTGTVQFKVGSTVIGKATLNSNGIATLASSTAGIAGGTYSVTANYLGDANDFTSTSSPVAITVQATDSVDLTASATNVPQGTPITLTATLHATAGTPAATGTIKFTYEGDGTSGTLGSVTLNAHGQASITIPATASKGEYAVTATYTGDAYNQPAASSALPVYVTAATTTTLSVSETQIHPGDSVVLTANVVSGSTPVSGGQVSFTVDGNVVATAQVNTQGVAATTVVAPSVPPGTYPLAAQYDGTTLDAPSTSSPVNVTVLK